MKYIYSKEWIIWFKQQTTSADLEINWQYGERLNGPYEDISVITFHFIAVIKVAWDTPHYHVTCMLKKEKKRDKTTLDYINNLIIRRKPQRQNHKSYLS